MSRASWPPSPTWSTSNGFRDGPTIELLSEVEFNRLAPILENAVYRIVQEGLANACRHSQSNGCAWNWCSTATISASWSAIGESVSIPREVEEGRFGLDGIRQRARLLGGQAALQSTPGEGTCITVDLPLAFEE